MAETIFNLNNIQNGTMASLYTPSNDESNSWTLGSVAINKGDTIEKPTQELTEIVTITLN